MADKSHLLVHILEKVDKIEEHVAAVRVDQAHIKDDLRYHIRRTDLLESDLKDVKKQVGWLAVPIDIVRAVLRWLKLIK